MTSKLGHRNPRIWIPWSDFNVKKSKEQREKIFKDRSTFSAAF